MVRSIRGTYFNGIVLDHFIFDNSIKRRVCIITGKEEELRRFIIEDLHSGATVYESYGAYNMEKRREIITIVDKGALDCTLKARIEGAVFRSVDQYENLPWGGAIR